MNEPRHGSLESLLNSSPRAKRVWAGGIWTEGPTWIPELGVVVFSNIPNDRQIAFNPRSGQAVQLRGGEGYFVNGTTLAPNGDLLLCEHGSRSLARLPPDGRRHVIADRFEGRRFNSPNASSWTERGRSVSPIPAMELRSRAREEKGRES